MNKSLFALASILEKIVPDLPHLKAEMVTEILDDLDCIKKGVAMAEEFPSFIEETVTDPVGE